MDMIIASRGESSFRHTAHSCRYCLISYCETGKIQPNDIIKTYYSEKEAIDDGWLRDDAGWVCPGCHKYIGSNDE